MADPVSMEFSINKRYVDNLWDTEAALTIVLQVTKLDQFFALIVEFNMAKTESTAVRRNRKE